MKKTISLLLVSIMSVCAVHAQDTSPNLLKQKELFAKTELFEPIGVFADKDANTALIADYEKNPKAYKPEQLLPVGMCYLSFSNFEKSGMVFEEFLKARPDNLRALRTLATIRLMMKQNDKAEELFKKAYSKGDESSAIFLASLYLIQKKPEAMKDIIGTIKRMSSKNLEALNLALVYALRDRKSIDETVVKEVLSAADPLQILASATPGGMTDVLRLYMATRNFWPEKLLIVPARAAAVSEAWTLALDLYKKVLAKDSKNAVALRGMGLVSYRTGDISSADDYIMRAYDNGDRDAVVDGLELFILSKRKNLWDKYYPISTNRELPAQLRAALVQYAVNQEDLADAFFLGAVGRGSELLYRDEAVRGLLKEGLKKYTSDKRTAEVEKLLRTNK